MKRIQLLGAADAVRRAWWIVVSGICAGVAAAVFVLHVTPKQYEARADLLATLEQDSTVDLDTVRSRLASIAQSALARPRSQSAVAEALQVDPERVSVSAALASVRTRLRVSVTRDADNPDINQVGVRYRDSDPDTAARLTNTMANLFISESTRNEPDSTVTTTEGPMLLELATEAAVPRRPVRPNAALVYASGLIIGPALLLTWFFVRRLLRPVLDSIASIQEASEVRVLVGIPEIPGVPTSSGGRGRPANLLYSAISLAILALVVLIWA